MALLGMVVVLAEEVLVAPVRVDVALVLLLALVPEDQPNTERLLVNATHSYACGHRPSVPAYLRGRCCCW